MFNINYQYLRIREIVEVDIKSFVIAVKIDPWRFTDFYLFFWIFFFFSSIKLHSKYVLKLSFSFNRGLLKRFIRLFDSAWAFAVFKCFGLIVRNLEIEHTYMLALLFSARNRPPKIHEIPILFGQISNFILLCPEPVYST